MVYGGAPYLVSCSHDSLHQRAPKARFLQRVDTSNGGPTGGTHLIFQQTRVLACVEHHLCRTKHGLGCQLHPTTFEHIVRYAIPSEATIDCAKQPSSNQPQAELCVC